MNESKNFLEKCVIHTRTHPKLLSLTSNLIRGDSSAVSGDMNISEDFFRSDVVIYRFSSMNNEISIRSCIECWLSDIKKKVMLMMLDMGSNNACEKVNYIRCCIDRQQNLGKNQKHFILLLHYPPSLLHIKKNFYPATFLGSWKHRYLDNIDGNTSIDMKALAMAACGIEISQDIADIAAGAKYLSSKCLVHVASEPLFYDHMEGFSLNRSINNRMMFRDRYKELKRLLLAPLMENVSCLDIIIKKFSEIWADDAVVLQIFGNDSTSIFEGTTNLSLSSFVYSVFQDSFLVYLTITLKNLNEWRGLDILLPEQSCRYSNELFALILNKLPSPPFNELIIQRPIPYRVRSLPMLANSYGPSTVIFPFFSLLSRNIEELIEDAEERVRENEDEKKVWAEFEALSVLNKVIVLIEENFLIKEVVEFMTKLSSFERNILVQRYLRQFLLWKIGCSNLSILLPWISNQVFGFIHKYKLAETGSILLIHILSNLKRMDILRLVSLTSSFSDSFVQGDLKHLLHLTSNPSQTSLVDAIVNTFISGFAKIETNVKLSLYFRSFIHNVFELNDVERFNDTMKAGPLRVLSLISILHGLAPVDIIKEAVQRWYSQESNTFNTTVYEEKNSSSLTTFFEFIEQDTRSAPNNEISWINTAQTKLLKLFFSPQWLCALRSHISEDLDFLINLIHRGTFTTTRLLVVLLKNCLCFGGESTIKEIGLDSDLLLFVCGQMHISSSKKPALLRYAPVWLTEQPEQIEIMNASNIHDPIQFYYASNNFAVKGNLPDTLFDILLRQLSLQAISSFDALSRLLALVDRRMAFERGDSSISELTLLSIMISAFTTYVITISAYETVAGSASILESEIGANFFEVIMHHDACQWILLFFSTIVRKGGKAILFEVLKSKFKGYSWCKTWQDCIPHVKDDIIESLRRTEKKLKEQESEEAHKAREYYHCPHCRQMYGIDMLSCGQLVCGRNTHTNQGNPTIGDSIVKETYGCGQSFRHENALKYTPDRGALISLESDVRRYQQALQEFESKTIIWKKLSQFTQPPLTFQIHRAATSPSIIPVASILDKLDRIDQGFNSENILDLVVKEKSYLKHLWCLSDLIEFYLWLNSTFRFLLTKEAAMRLKMNELKSENKLLKRFDQSHVRHILRLWGKVKNGFDSYILANNYRTRWECEEVNIPFCTIGDAPLYMLLSTTKHPTDGDEFQDVLFLVVNDIIEKYNAFANKLNSINQNDVRQIIELNPKFLIRGGCADIAYFSEFFKDCHQVLDGIVESHWISEANDFDVPALIEALEAELCLGLRHPMIKSPLDHLRERFRFRDVNEENTTHDVLNLSKCDLIKSSISGLIFARHR